MFCKKTQKTNLSRKTQILFGYLCFTFFFSFFFHFPSFYLLPAFSIWFWFFFPLFHIPSDIYPFLLAPLSEWWKNFKSSTYFLASVFFHCKVMSSPDNLNTFFHAARRYYYHVLRLVPKAIWITSIRLVLERQQLTPLSPLCRNGPSKRVSL